MSIMLKMLINPRESLPLAVDHAMKRIEASLVRRKTGRKYGPSKLVGQSAEICWFDYIFQIDATIDDNRISGTISIIDWNGDPIVFNSGLSYNGFLEQDKGRKYVYYAIMNKLINDKYERKQAWRA